MMPNFAAGQEGRRADQVMRRDRDMSCHFAAPMPHRVPCHPAAFHRKCGEKHHRLTEAYGQSRPVYRY